MDFALDDEQQLIVATVKRFADRELREWAADADRAGAPPARLLAAGGDLGLLLDAVPAEHGGLLEGAYAHTARALRGLELGRGCSALAALLESNVEPALAAARWAAPALRDELYAALAAGGLVTTAHDAAGRLAVRADGDGVAIDGELGPVPALAGASHLLLSARVDAADGPGEPALLLVPADTFAVAPVVPSGWRAARWGKLSAHGVRVGAGHVLARGDAAAAAVRDVLSWYRLSLAARAVGAAAAAMAHAREYGEVRVQFGQPIGTFESLAGLRDGHETEIAAARLLVLHAAWLIDRGAPDAHDTVDRARDLAARTLAAAAVDAVQIFGGYGFVNDYPVEKIMRDARAYEVLGGNQAFERARAQRRPAQA